MDVGETRWVAGKGRWMVSCRRERPTSSAARRWTAIGQHKAGKGAFRVSISQQGLFEEGGGGGGQRKKGAAPGHSAGAKESQEGSGYAGRSYRR